ncbi:MAG TPA: PQQ-binding-like beta-propeller repeat protein [Solirubrobacteraceae bacterium]|jgi:outer membrane protein assembly factor BamB|nr:PQQ-binding-like beta-propeller repeat protein [Solirubrobacteraceae bacterium]
MAVLAVAVAAVLVIVLHEPRNVSHPKVEFTAPTTTTTPAKPKVVRDFLWPRYGYDAARTRVFDSGAGLEPPFRRGWTYYGSALLEFPPVIRGDTLYILNDSGEVLALNKLTGHVIWHRTVGTLAAASPAIGNGLVFVPLLSTVPGAKTPDQGRFVALSQRTGHIVWSMSIPPGSESSPLAWGQMLYFGDQGGTVRAVQASTGHVRWTYHASGSVKGAIALANGTLYFADYAGRAYAVRANSGRQVWAVATNGAQDGFGSGNFYSSPAVAFGRVYIGNTDGRVYSFAAATGQLAWATGTGAYVYSSPAVANIPGLGPTVYIGSYDGNLYAFNARSGAVRWAHNAGGRISGAPTIVGNVVYYSNLASKTTTGLNVRTGRVVFTFPAGSFNPIIADPTAMYLSGYAQLYQLLPRRPARASTATTATTAKHP